MRGSAPRRTRVWLGIQAGASCVIALMLWATAGIVAELPAPKAVAFPPEDLRGQPHSMQDPVAYARSRIPIGLRAVIDRGGAPAITVVQGGEEVMRTSYRHLRLEEVSDRFDDGKDTSFFRDRDTGRWFDFRNYGYDLALHRGLIYHFAGIPRDRLDLVLDPERDHFNQAFFDSVARAPDLKQVVIGSRRSLARDLTLRKEAALQAAALEDALATPGTRASLDASVQRAQSPALERRVAELLRVVEADPPSVFFRSSERYFQLRAFRADLKTLLTGPAAASAPELVRLDDRLKGARTGGEAGREIPGGFGMFRFTVTGDDGERRSLYALRHPYGNLARTMVQHLAVRRPTDVLFIGSAGGLSADVQPGDVVVPAGFQTVAPDLTFSSRAGTNRARRPEILALPGFKESAADHCSVFSPLVETAALVDAMRARGIDSVDCEAAHLFDGPPSDTAIGVLLLITDLPGQGATLEDVDADAPHLRDAQMRLLDGVIAFLRITDVELE